MGLRNGILDINNACSCHQIFLDYRKRTKIQREREVLSPGREFRCNTAENKTILCFKQESYSMKIVFKKIFFWKWFSEMIRIKNEVRGLIKSY